MFLLLGAALLIIGVSCNSKSSDDETEIAVTPALVAVRNFHLMANDSVMAKLDSVFFAIDLNTGVIFNADSLPKGTDVSKVVPSITFANSMTKAELSYHSSETSEALTSNYLTNPSDTIDFSRPVTLDVVAQDGMNSFSYTIKVNVHLQDPDTIVWDKMASSPLPARFKNPVSQKTLIQNDVAYCLIEENNDEYTLSTSSDLFQGVWMSENFYPGFEPNVSSFTASASAFYLTSVAGELFYSPDLTEWIDTEQKWTSIVGAYGDLLLGIRFNGTEFVHTCFPMPEGFEETPLEEGFPIYGFSPLGVIESKWADLPIAILSCGMTEGGMISSRVWAYDGTRWAVINQDSLPPLESPMMARYVVYRDTTTLFKQRELDIWLLFGGVDFENVMNREVYMSYDNGVHWQLAPSGMQLPEEFPDLGFADVVVAPYDLEADLSDAWEKISTKTRASGYTITGYDIQWQCPYLYIIGGYLPDNSLNSTIYRGVLQRLTFTPQI